MLWRNRDYYPQHCIWTVIWDLSVKYTLRGAGQGITLLGKVSLCYRVMSTITPDAESFVVINQAGPHSSQTKTTEGQQLPPGLTNVPKPIVRFYKGQPEALGATQIFVGVFFFVIGICLTVTCDYFCSYMHFVIYSGVLFWSALMQIVAGSLSVAASVKPTLGKMRSSLVVNIISSLFGAAAIILVSISFFSFYRYNIQFCIQYTWESRCKGVFDLYNFTYGIVSILLLFTILIFCISISTAVFGCKTLCITSFQEVTVVIYQTAPPTTNTSDTKDFSSVPGSSDGISEIQEAVKY